jgi:hypothetical protein
MSDQTLKVKLEGDATGLQTATQKASSAVQTLDKTVEKSSNSLNKNIKEAGNIAQHAAGEVQSAARKTAHAVDELADAVKKGTDKSSSEVKKGTDSIDGNLSKTNDKLKAAGKFFSEVGKLAADGLKRLYNHLLEIGKASRELGTTAEEFQKLQKTAKKSGDELSDIEDVFKNIQKTAKDAISGDSGAIAQLAAVGVTVDQLRGKRPEQIFSIVASAMESMGYSADDQAKKINLCGESITRLNGGLQAYVNMSGEGIFTDETVRAAQELSNCADELEEAIIGIAENLGAVNLFQKFVNQIKECLAEIKALNGDTPEIQGKTWNEVNVSLENRQKAREYDLEWKRRQAEERNRQNSLQAASRSQIPGSPGFSNEILSLVTPEQITLPKDKNGLTPGQAKYAYDPVTNPEGFQPANTPSKATKEDLENARKQVEENKEKQRRDQAVRDNAAKIQDLRGLTNADQLKEEIDEYEKALADTLGGGALSKDFESEIREKDASITRKKENEAQNKRIWEATATPKEKALKSIQDQVTAEREATNGDFAQLDYVDYLERTKLQEWLRQYGNAMDYRQFRDLMQKRRKEAAERRQLAKELSQTESTGGQTSSVPEVQQTPASGNAVPKATGKNLKESAIQRSPSFGQKMSGPAFSLEDIGKKLDRIAMAAESLGRNVYVVK